MKFTNLRVSTRLGVGFGLLFVGAAVLAATGWLGIQRQAQVASTALKRDVEFAQAIGKVAINVQTLRRFEKDMLFNLANAKKAQEYKEKHAAARGRINELMSVALQNGVDAEDAKGLDTLGTLLMRYDGGIEQVYAAITSGELTTPEQGYKKVAQFRQIIRDTEEVTDTLFERADKRIEGVEPALAGIKHDVSLALLVVAAVVAVGLLVVGTLTARSITVPVAEAVRVAEALAQGDLTLQVEAHSKDELGRLLRALKATVGQLGAIVGRIKETSDTVGAASREIAQSNVDMSTRTEEQASSLEEASASMQQMSSTVSQNAQNAATASELADQASGIAAKGGDVVREAVQTMNAVTASSKKISDIIGVIDGIAFQTNILALNAAVEAARAGEQGRGFAVVASEVRSLAHRSAGAAKEIKDLISDSVSKVDSGARQVNDAGATMEEVVAAVKKVSSLVAEISVASREQAQGIEQVTESVSQMEKVTQQNAAMVEEASAAASSLAEQSRALIEAVGAFRLQGRQAAPTLAAVRLPAGAQTGQAAAQLRHTASRLALARKGNGHLEEQWQEI
ncbi:MAG TPA: methyl-accepting chemotaxis protein [Burkholderiales bacterium]|nr:methyl-accepting chemotaxis protein [Burkholderiales bacterium]